MTNSILDDFKNAWNKPNNAPAQFIIINVVIFLAMITFMLFLGKDSSVFSFIYKQFAMPSDLGELITRPWTIITYSFAHSLRGIGHIFWNMIGFFWFSKLILEYMGNDKVISLYVTGAIAGGLAFLLAYNLIPAYVNSGHTVMVGASAAVYATVVGAATLLPNYTFYLIFFGPVKIKYIAAFFVISSYVGLASTGSGIADTAHLGGAFWGFLFVRQMQKGTDLGAWVIQSIDFIKSFFKKPSNIKVTHRSEKAKTVKSRPVKKPTSKKAGEASQEQIDAILDKISQSGYESLTKEEKQQLFNASKK